ncbi:MAG: membrane protein insertase YidC [Myxococcota bacterium]|jgi:YidC/Oxa1 family membrane protein insertase
MEDNGKRTLLAFALAMAVLFVWQYFFTPKPQPKVAAMAADASVMQQDGGVQAAAAAKDVPVSGEKATGASPAVQAPEIAAKAAPKAPEKIYRVANELWDAEFSTNGAALVSFKLKKYSVATKDPARVDLVRVPLGSEVQPLSSTFAKGSGIEMDPAAGFELVSQTATSLSFRWKGQGAEVEKTYTFAPGEYSMDVVTSVRNTGDRKLSVKPVLNWVEKAPEFVQSSSSWFSPSAPEDYHQPASLMNDKFEKFDQSKYTGKTEAFEGRLEWAGADSRYFLAAIVPQIPGRTTWDLSVAANGAFTAAVVHPDLEIDPGQSAKASFKVFVGPKDYGMLKKLNYGLDRAVDFGWLTVLCVPMLWLLRLFYGFIGNWGVAIIFLTILVKLISMPLTVKSYRSMQEMAKLKPKIDELQKKYKDDRQKQSEEMMKLYQQHGVSPLSGCLPMLLQMPIWIALYRMLYGAVELYQTHFIRGWLDNLAEKDPYYILPVLMGVGMFFQQKLTPQTMDSQQAKVMLYFMPIFFTLIMLSLPSGLTLYIFVNTLLSIAHQFYINRNARTVTAPGTAS